MRVLAVVLACSLLATGCVAQSYQIPSSELTRLAQAAPETRGQHVRVVQEVLGSDVPAAAPVTRETEVVIVPSISVGVGGGPRRGGYAGGGGRLPSGKIGGAGADGKETAIAVLVLAATALVTAAVIEGSRFDGWAELHPMHPVHLIGKDGGYAVMPLAAIDAETAARTQTAVVRPFEGPWRELEHAPLTRTGLTYGMYGGLGSLRSADGALAMGPAWTLQLGYFPRQTVGVLGSVFFGWRQNKYDATLFETRYTAEVQVLPVQLGILHAGVYGGLGYAYRFEDAIKLAGDRVIAGNEGSGAFVGGAMFQLDINTRLALTARLGAAFAHDEQMHDVIFGLSVY